MFLLGQDQFVDQGSRVVEANFESLPTGGQGDAGSDVGFSKARITDHDDGLGLSDVGAASQFQNPLFGRAGNTREVKVSQLLEYWEASALDPLDDTVPLPLSDFLLGQGQEKAVVAVVGLGRLVPDAVEMRAGDLLAAGGR